MAENKLYQNLPQTQETSSDLSEEEFQELVRNMKSSGKPDQEFLEAIEEAEMNRVGYDLDRVLRLHEANKKNGTLLHW